MWSWVAHRITGVLTFFFLFAHVLDTALVRVSPEAYNTIIETYKNPLVNLMEVGLVGAVLYHALNGIRIMLVDFWAKGARYQRQMLWIMLGDLVRGDDPGRLLHAASAPSLICSGVAHDRRASIPPATRGIEAPARTAAAGSPAGAATSRCTPGCSCGCPAIVLVVLVLGHLLIMNVLDGGVHRINWGFVAGRWASPFWQVWDLIMLWLAEIHGANGLRTVINDYARKDGTRFWLQLMLAASVVLILGVGTLVIFTFDPNMLTGARRTCSSTDMTW